MNYVLSALRSLNLRIAALVAVSVAVAMTCMVIYVDRATYRLTYNLQTRAMAETAKSAVRALDDTVEDHVQLIRHFTAQDIVVEALQGGGKDKSDEAQRYITTLMGSFKDLWSLYVVDMNGIVVAGRTSGGDDTRGKQRGQHPEIQATLKGGGLSISKSQFMSDIGERLVYAVTSPVKDKNGKVIGSCRTAVNISDFNKGYIGSIKAADTGYAFMIDAEGKGLAHPDASLVLKTLDLPFIKEIVQKKSGTCDFEFKGQNKVVSFQQSGKTGWIIGVTVPMTEALADANTLRTMVALIGLAVCIILTVILLLATRKLVVRPILALERFAGEIAAGNFGTDLSGRFSCELATLAASIRKMKEEIKREIAFAKAVLAGIPMPCAVFDLDDRTSFVNQAMLDAIEKPGRPEDFLGCSSGTLIYGDATKMSQTSAALKNDQRRHVEYPYLAPSGIRKIFDVNSIPLRDLDGKLFAAMGIWFELTEIREQQQLIESQRDRVAETAKAANAISDRLSTAAEELAAQIEEASRGTENQRERLNETTSAVEQMNASVLDVARNSSETAGYAIQAKDKAQAGGQVVEKAMAAFNRVEQNTLAMKGQVEDLSRKADSIGSIMQIIEDIADQTNLLALNAAIEAARAGDAGRGFAVVADEVRKLAEKTMTATKDVGRSIKEIQESTGKALHTMDEAGGVVVEATALSSESGDALREIVSISGKSADQIQSIAAAAEEQSAASEQIARSAEEVSVIASETADAMNQSAQAVAELARMAVDLKELIHAMQE